MTVDPQFVTVLEGSGPGDLQWSVQVREIGPADFETFVRCESDRGKAMLGFGGPKVPNDEPVSVFFGATDFTPSITLVRTTPEVSAVLGESASGRLYEIELSQPTEWGLRFGVRFSGEPICGLRVEMEGGQSVASRPKTGRRPILPATDGGGWVAT